MKLIVDNFTQNKETVVVGSSNYTNFLPENLKSPFRMKEWKSDPASLLTTEWVLFDLGSAKEIDSIIK